MITIRISGPKKDDPKAQASRLASMYSVAGKVVRKYDAENEPAEMPQDAGVVIIVTEENDNVGTE